MLVVYLVLHLGLTSSLPADSYERLWAQGRGQLSQALYTEAEQTLRTAVHLAETERADDTTLAILLNDLASASRRLGSFEEAERLYKRAVALLQRKNEKSQRHLAMILNNQGTLYREMGFTLRSAACFEESLRVATKAQLKNDPLMAAILEGIAASQSASKGDMKRAERALLQAVRLREAALHPTGMELAQTLNNLGVVQMRLKQFVKAEASFVRAMGLIEGRFGPRHPDMAVALTNLGVLYSDRKEYGQAEEVLRRALQIRRDNLPPDHPRIASSLLNLGQVLVSTQHLPEAEELLGEAVRIRSQHQHVADSEEALTFESYALALRLNGHSTDASAVEARAKAIRAELRYTLRP